MALNAKTIAAGVGDILNVDGGLTGSGKQVVDGDGIGSPIYISTTKVGIGVADPDQSLEVAGNIHISDGGMLQISDTSGTDQRIHFDGSTDWSIGQRNSVNKFQISKNSGLDTVYLTVDTTGDVGIGTASPQENLHIYKSSADVKVEIESVAAGANAVLKLQSPSSHWEMINDGTSGNLDFQRAGSSKVFFKSDGNVGIGTNDPLQELDLVGQFISADNKTDDTNKQAIFLSHQYDSGTETEGFMMMETFAGSSANRIDIGGGHSAYNAATEITFNTAANTTTDTGTERMSIQSDGKIGIGTTSPQYKFDVDGNADNTFTASFGSGTLGVGEWTGIHFGYAQDADTDYRKSAIVFEVVDGSARGKIHFLNESNADGTSAVLGDSKMTIDHVGNVGIGKTSPGNKLEVDGAVKLFQASDALASGIIIENAAGSNSSYIWQNGTSLNLFTAADTGITILDGGNVGIGSTDPKGPLHVKCDSNNYGLVLEDNGDTETFSLAVTGGGHLEFRAGTTSDLDSGATSVMFKDDGAIGMGDAPDSTTADILTLNKLAGDSQLDMNVYSDNTGNEFQLQFGRSFQDTVGHTATADNTLLGAIQWRGSNNSTWTYPARIKVVQDGATGAADDYTGAEMLFQTSDGTATQATRMIIDKNGRVGIGQPSPTSSRFEVVETSANGTGFTLDHNPTITTGSSYAANIDVNKSGVSADGATVNTFGLNIDIDDDATNHVNSTTVLYGLNVELTGKNVTGGSGTHTSVGIYSNTTGSNTNYPGVFMGGNVGIGTNTPDALLELSSAAADSTILRLTNTASSLTENDTISAIQFYNSDITDDSPNIAASIYADAGPSGGSGKLRFHTTPAGSEGVAATATMTLDHGGRVGIGEDTPDQLLHLKDTNGAEMVLQRTAGHASNLMGGIHFGNADVDEYLASIYGYQDGTTSAGRLEFHTEANGADKTVKMTIKGDGKVGIGVTDPVKKLQVDGAIIVKNNYGYVQQDSEAQSAQLLNLNPSDLLTIGDATHVDDIYIATAGGVGIGTANPYCLLSVGSLSNAVVAGEVQVSTGGLNVNMTEDNKYAAGIKNQHAGGGGLVIWGGDSSNEYALRVEDYDGANDLLCVRGDGNIGIGTDTPDVELDVAGRVAIGNQTELTIASGAITITQSYHKIDTEGDASSDDLATINGGGAVGTILVLSAANDARTVVVKNGTGNIVCGADFNLDNSSDTITLIWGGSQWMQISSSNNAA